MPRMRSTDALLFVPVDSERRKTMWESDEWAEFFYEEEEDLDKPYEDWYAEDLP